MWISLGNLTSLINVEDVLLISHSKLRQGSGICGMAQQLDIMGTLKAIAQLEARLAFVSMV